MTQVSDVAYGLLFHCVGFSPYLVHGNLKVYFKILIIFAKNQFFKSRYRLLYAKPLLSGFFGFKSITQSHYKPEVF
jgi:hypothetical protein